MTSFKEMLQTKLKLIADAIRACVGLDDTSLIAPDEFPAQIEKVWENGYDTYYRQFWSGYLQNGNITSCSHLFSGAGWTKNNFKPPYSLKIKRAWNMFASNQIVADLVSILEEPGITFDFSECEAFDGCFYNCNFTRLPVVSTVSCPELPNLCRGASRLVTAKFILKSDGSQTFSYSFSGCYELKNITFEGLIGNDIDFSDCAWLSKDSINNIISHTPGDYWDEYGTAYNLSVKLSSMAVNDAYGLQRPLFNFNSSTACNNWVDTTANATGTGIVISTAQHRPDRTYSAYWSDTTDVRSFRSPAFSGLNMNWTNYSYLNMWIYSEKASGDTIGVNIQNADGTYYRRTFTVDWSGWKLIKLKYYTSDTSIDWTNVSYITFTSSGWDTTPTTNTKLYFDSIFLSESEEWLNLIAGRPSTTVVLV